MSAPETNLSLSVIWDDCTQSVYYIEFHPNYQQPAIFRYDNEEDKTYSAYIDGYAGPAFILPISQKCDKYKNLFLVGLHKFTRIIEWDGRSTVARVVSTVFDIEENDPLSILGVSRQSERGRFYGGSIHITFCSAPANSSLYSYTKEKGLQRLFGDVHSTIGLTFDKNAGYLYHLDSCTGAITRFQTDSKGDICKMVFIRC